MVKTGITPQIAKKIREEKGLEDTKLQELRVKRGMSQRELAEKADMKIRAIQIYEQRSRDIDSAKLITLCKLCLALDCKLEDILEDEETIEKLRATK